MITLKTKLEPDFLLLPYNFGTFSGFLVVDCIVTRISIKQQVIKLVRSLFACLFFLTHHLPIPSQPWHLASNLGNRTIVRISILDCQCKLFSSFQGCSASPKICERYSSVYANSSISCTIFALLRPAAFTRGSFAQVKMLLRWLTVPFPKPSTWVPTPSGLESEVQCRMTRPSQLMAVPWRHFDGSTLKAVLSTETPSRLGMRTKYQLSTRPGISSVQTLNPWDASLMSKCNAFARSTSEGGFC